MFAIFIAFAASVLAPMAVHADCGGVEVAILNCETRSTGDAVEQSALWAILELTLNILIGAVGIAAVGGLIYGAIMYSSARDNPGQVQEAIGVIRNVIIGLVLFVLMFAILQYLIPGGIF